MSITSTLRHFLTYRGVTLPLTLTEELSPDALRNRNTYFRAAYDAEDRMLWLEEIVQGEVELRHDYHWGADGMLRSAIVRTPDEAPQLLQFD